MAADRIELSLRALSELRLQAETTQRRIRSAALQAARDGAAITDIAAASGVHRSTVHRWVRAQREQADGPERGA